MKRDVVVIGSGAGGAPLALALAEAGHQVLVLEKGPEHSREDYVKDEISATRRDFFFPPMAEEMHILVEEGTGYGQSTQHGWVGNCVGGGTVVMAGYFVRFHPDDFRLKSRCGEYEAVEDWPYSYEELEPYYSRVEWEIGASGVAGSNPFEGSRSKPYPLPPVDSHPMVEFLEKACERLDLEAFPTPRAVLSENFQGRHACIACGFCGGYGCQVGAKSSTQEAILPKAVATGNCEIRPRSMVREVTVGKDGRATGCIFFDEEGKEHRVEAKVVCVCCSPVETARLLLMSKSSLFPDGLANGNGLVGRNLQFHGFSSGQGWFRYDRHPEKELRDPRTFLERSVMDHYFLPEGVSDFPKGGLIRFGMPNHAPISTALRLADENGSMVWGTDLKRRLREYFREHRMVDFEVFHDFIPNDRTFVVLEPSVTDKWGLPVARIHLDNIPHHHKAGKWLVDRGLEVLDEMGADKLVPEEIGEVAGYLVFGTCRAGHDPQTSVLNEHCQAHSVPNLFVVDSSFMPTSGGTPPSLTIMANSFRTADHIIRRARAGDFDQASLS